MNVHAQRAAWNGVDTSRPPVLARVVKVPSAPPWDQAAAARLKALRDSPLPQVDLTIKLVRLAAWRPRGGGRFAALYVRTSAIGGGFRTQVVVEGRRLAVHFTSPGAAKVEALHSTVHVASALLAVLSLIGAGALALSNRSEQARGGADLSQRAERRLTLWRAAASRVSDQAVLLRTGGPGEPLHKVLGEVADVAADRSETVVIEGLHWRSDGVGLSIRGGDEAPAPDFDRIEAPLRPGVWLWVRPRRVR